MSRSWWRPVRGTVAQETIATRAARTMVTGAARPARTVGGLSKGRSGFIAPSRILLDWAASPGAEPGLGGQRHGASATGTDRRPRDHHRPHLPRNGRGKSRGVPGFEHRSEERRVGKSVDLGGRRIIKKKKKK